jgi:prevent-host-death family protein
MEEISATKFRATCLAVMDRVQRTKIAVRITRYGKPIADVVPASIKKATGKREFGRLAGKLIISGDVIAPAFDASEGDHAPIEFLIDI